VAAIAKGDKVSIHYTAKLEDGTVVDQSQPNQPLRFTAGSDELIPGVSQAVIGMEQGGSKTVTVPPELGYGPHHPEAMQQAERKHFPSEVKVGDVFKAVAGEQEMIVRVIEVEDETVTLDANHPLAGQTLVFDLTVA